MIILSNTYSGRANAPNASYPQGGSFKNETAPGADDGTPYEQTAPNDVRGFFEALMAAAGLTASGSVETATSSQLFDALTQNEIIGDAAISDVSITKLTSGAMTLTSGSITTQMTPVSYTIVDSSSNAQTLLFNNYIEHKAGDGSAYNLGVSVKEGSVQFDGTDPAVGSNMRRESISISFSTVTSTQDATSLMYTNKLVPNVTITGLPYDDGGTNKTLFQNATLQWFLTTPERTITAPAIVEWQDDGSNNAVVARVQVVSEYALSSASAGNLFFDYDPAYVD
jgi:hypothetical protein